VALGIALLIRLPVAGSYWTNLFPTILIMPIGMAMTFMPLMVAATSGVSQNEAGLASGLINTSQQMGGALGLAILSSVAASMTASHMSMGALEAVVYGYTRAYFVAALFIVIATIIGLLLIRDKKAPIDAAVSAQSHAL
jgi:sugar phosphate permease